MHDSLKLIPNFSSLTQEESEIIRVVRGLNVEYRDWVVGFVADVAESFQAAKKPHLTLVRSQPKGGRKLAVAGGHHA